MTTAVVDVDTTRTSQVRTASFQPNIEKYNEGCVNCNFGYPTINERLTINPNQESWELSPDIKYEECVRALGLALMDYMRKSHTKGFTISLSGGADSAMVTYLCVMGIRLTIEELGVAKFITKYCPQLGEGARCSNFDQWTKEEQIKRLISLLITTAYQATENSGNTTKTAARELANSLGVKHYELDVQPMFNDYKKSVEQIWGKELTFEENDVTLQNLQARVRSPEIWAIANLMNKLLLTTSNMSEAAVGYFTMDGDSSGCLAPIGGLSKQYVREFLRWVESNGPIGFSNLPTMGLINNQQPTAELRPEIYKQTDENDLMSYWILHEIEKLMVKNRQTPVEVYQSLKIMIEYDNNKLINDITKFYRLYSINQWKRERLAISFHMDDHNLDPKTWCRVPILSSCYQEEIEELQKYFIENTR